MQQVERLIFDLRRGLPVLIRAGQTATLVAPLEGMTDHALALLAEHAGNDCALVVTRHRLELLGIDIEDDAARLPIHADDSAATVIEWACARHPETRPERQPRPTTAGDDAALTLMRRGLLIPAAVTVAVAAWPRSRPGWTIPACSPWIPAPLRPTSKAPRVFSSA